MIVKTDAIVLSAMKYRDTSRILRLYTREFGKISVIAKGARDSKSRFRSALQPMNIVSCVIYKNENRELQLLSQCDVLHDVRHLSEDVEKMHVAMTTVELVDRVTHDEERNERLFLLMTNLLQTVNRATKTTDVALYWFEMKLSELLGFKPGLRNCTNCGKSVEEELIARRRFVMGNEGVLCVGCSESSGSLHSVSSGTLRVLQRLQEAENIEVVMNVRFTAAGKEEAKLALRQHFQKHVEGYRGLKSEEVFAAIL